MYGRDAARVILQSCSLPIVQIMHTRVPGYVPAKLAGAVIHGRHLIENQNLRPGLLALLYGRRSKIPKTWPNWKVTGNAPRRAFRSIIALIRWMTDGETTLTLQSYSHHVCL